MSRVGKKTIKVPAGVKVNVGGARVEVQGPKGQLKCELPSAVKLVQDGDVLSVTLTNPDDRGQEQYRGLARALVSNMVVGVHTGFQKTLTLVGVGYRANLQGRELHLTLGFSHPVVYQVPEGLDVKVDKQTTVVISGADRAQVGQAAANIRGYRPPEVYHGKGVRYSDERIITKVGKSAGKK